MRLMLGARVGGEDLDQVEGPSWTTWAPSRNGSTRLFLWLVRLVADCGVLLLRRRVRGPSHLRKPTMGPVGFEPTTCGFDIPRVGSPDRLLAASLTCEPKREG